MHFIFYIITGLLYVTGFSLLFRRLNHQQGKPVADKWLIVAFAAKVMAGIAYGYIYAHIFEVSDSWVYFEASLIEYHQLLTHPSVFFSTGIHFNNAGDLFSAADDASWSNAGENLLIKLLAVFNVFSGFISVILHQMVPHLMTF